MHKNRILVGALALLAGLGSAMGRQLTVSEALAAAGAERPGIARIAGTAPTAALTLSRDGLNTVYVVDGVGQGYVVLAADDVAPAVLGYSDSGSFDAGSIPPNMQAWLDDYSAYIATAASTGSRVVAAPADPTLGDIAPITKTRWNQAAPYNDLCPRVNGQQTYTGCVATAIAQVMKTYEWPVTGTGTNSYTWNNQTLSYNFGATTFDWANMADIYNSNSTQAQNAAVAELMYACGIACYMNYGTGGSGANGVNLAVGLINYLGYDASLKYLSRDYFTLPQWSRMLHEQLSTGHPLYYDGANATVGHAFVIDGYRRSDGFFHLNWGWGGMSDGYYSIVTLDPDAQGIGGSTDGYYLGQSAIFGLKPAEEGSQLSPVFVAENIPTEPISVTRGEYAEIGNSNSGFYNVTLGTVDAEIGVELTAAGQEPLYVFYPETVEFQYGHGFRALPIPTDNFPTGTFTARPVARCNGQTVAFLTPVGSVSHFTVEADETTVTFNPVVEAPELELVEIKALSPFYRGRVCYSEVTVKNLGSEYYGTLNLAFVNTKGSESTLGSAVVDILTDGTATVTISGSLTALTPAGTCYLRLYDDDHNQIGQDVAVELEKAPSGTPSPVFSNAHFPGITGGESLSDPAEVNAADLNVAVDLTVGEGYFTSPVRAYVFDMTGASVGFMSTPYVACTGNEAQTLTFSGDLSEVLTTGNIYMLAFAYFDKNQYNLLQEPMLYLTVGDFSGIEAVAAADYGVYPNPAAAVATVTAPAEITAVEVFDLAGALRASYVEPSNGGRLDINVGNLAAGQYLLRVSTADNATHTLRLIKK